MYIVPNAVYHSIQIQLDILGKDMPGWKYMFFHLSYELVFVPLPVQGQLGPRDIYETST
jgi:hypothetical protein